ncbi:rhomboid family intramembrane serine protease [Candidatus Woesearchaeota archaeon]|nr:rhomboid family intramembrane serine protease [Candidatus Woesearchaeota archaeon]
MKINVRNAVMPLIIITILVFMLQAIFGSSFTGAFLLTKGSVFSEQWRLVTAMFLHGSPMHLFFNMYALLIFGPLLESRIGARRFFIVYLGSGLIANIISSFFYNSALGASGAVMGMLGALIILMPDLQLLFFFIVPMPLWVAGILWAALDSFGVFFPSGTGNIAHLAGMACGLGYGMMLKEKKKTFDRKFSSKSHMDKEDMEEYLRTGRI